MRGEVLTFEATTGEGTIAGDDGVRYGFAASDLRGATFIEQGQRVDFVPGADGRAQDIIAMRPAYVPPSSAGGGRGQFDFGGVISRTFTAVKQNAAICFGASAVMVGVPSLLTAFGGAGFMTGATERSSSSVIGGVVVYLVGIVLYLIGVFVLQGMVVKVAVGGFNGKRVTFRDALGVGVQYFLPLLGLAIAAGLATGLGYLLLIVPGVLLSIVWSVSAPALVMEKRGVFESLQRSRDLTRGYRWQVFGLLVIYIILSWIVGAAVAGLGVATGGSFMQGTPNLAFNLITQPLVNILSSVVASAGVASLYYELRTAKEGVGADNLRAIFD
ncbi:YciC family protein [Brevundimonas sp. SORGH_AS_0993]|uniref:YciC family protein n=1 Tax=Brevundimonas sp. SORGH_AS_0993 TaxID=3041794 RepID=UPI00278A97A5|nr:YciC family protein [Brevundimonas sp. SORGH_AS_0993]MDQ1155665.1 cold shock CspA family protein [Brevundimonas sp. SORGH_AS_0993]